ncbi:hypothetical protein HMPREF9565_00381 [Cutibacterium acnes HL053PA2]|nr:hypothetical protein HMPREF9612_01654 [Cutibacterium acnes HL063PA2]EFT19509.1 hypothetical protein HMPREF9566_02646 [Cutibacterium acnes HL045PA1]EFT32702.1 hypothetical protein HMPREF9596_02412 [Cutibacterium acnes HL005PA3]EFT51407.1 hypothetical protein HMPREF9565_00381 [Cutibacterium acnes HL053PA2]
MALGGGGFSMSNRGEPTALDRHILDLSGKSSPPGVLRPHRSC